MKKYHPYLLPLLGVFLLSTSGYSTDNCPKNFRFTLDFIRAIGSAIRAIGSAKGEDDLKTFNYEGSQFFVRQASIATLEKAVGYKRMPEFHFLEAKEITGEQPRIQCYYNLKHGEDELGKIYITYLKD